MKQSSQGFYAFDCPFCDMGKHKMNCAVKFEWKLVKCWSCGYHERIETFVMDVEGVNSAEAWRLIDNQKASRVSLDIAKDIQVLRKVVDVSLPDGFTSILEGDTILAKRARKYLEQDRHLDLEQLDRLGVGYCPTHAKDEEADYFGYIIIPFKFRGVLQYYLGRDYIGNFLRYKNPPKALFGVGKADLLFNEDALELRKVVFITEGCFDALTLGKNGVATMGWSLSEQQKGKLLKSNCKTLVFVPDVGYYAEAVKTAVPFIGHKQVKVLPMDTLAEYGKDVNEVGWERVLELNEKTKPMTFADAVDAVNRY